MGVLRAPYWPDEQQALFRNRIHNFPHGLLNFRPALDRFRQIWKQAYEGATNSGDCRHLVHELRRLDPLQEYHRTSEGRERASRAWRAQNKLPTSTARAPHCPVSSARVAAATSCLAHQRLADEKAFDPGLGQTPAIGVGENAALADTIRPGGISGASLSHTSRRGLEGLEVAIVDADQPPFQRERALQFLLVMHLDQHVEAEVVGGLVELARIRRRARP